MNINRIFNHQRHPLGACDYKGESSSDTQQSTTSTTTDARIGVDNGGIVLQGGSSIDNSFPSEVANNLISKVVDFSGTVLTAAKSTLEENTKAQRDIINGVLDFGQKALAASPATSPAASSGIIQSGQFKNLYIAAAIGVVVLLFVYKKKR